MMDFRMERKAETGIQRKEEGRKEEMPYLSLPYPDSELGDKTQDM